MVIFKPSYNFSSTVTTTLYFLELLFETLYLLKVFRLNDMILFRIIHFLNLQKTYIKCIYVKNSYLYVRFNRMLERLDAF